MMLSVVIPSYCAEKNLDPCLQSIDSQKDENVEVIVVDCSPHDEVKSICEKYQFVTFIKSEVRFNPGEGRNIGAKASKGSHLIFIDADVVLEQNAIANIRRNITNGFNNFGGALELNRDINNDFSANVEHFYFNHESQSTRKVKKRSNLSSAFMIFDKSVFLNYGGFKDIPRMQDTELTERLVSNGETLYLAPDVIGYQIQDSPLKKVLKKISITGNNLYFIRYGNHSEKVLWKILMAMILPLLMLAKVTRINVRQLKYAFSVPNLLIYSPFMYVCGFYWMLGFYRGLIVNDGIASGR
ncbi:glycosyltransferase family 2 protein [Shewanella sp. ENK2]|uniref:glycosyltransferase family 2 protein n=1 Tax=Shewanella sp. ENK2 TaxID=2775245 RepID=UPI003747CB29